MPFALLFAFAASVGVHLGVLFGPDIHLGWPENPEPVLLQATLKRPPRVLPAAPSTAAAKPPKPVHTHVRPARPVVQPVAQSAAPAAETSPSSPATPASPVPEAVQTVVEMAPLRGRSRFRICKGAQGFEIGQGEHVFEIAEGRYRIRTHAETTGLVALFKSLRVDQDSMGHLNERGLVPERFTTVRDGVGGEEDAEFDWSNNKIRLGREIGNQADGGRDLHPGAQDLASFLYQLGYLGARVDGTRIGVTTGKYYEQFRFTIVGEENLDTAAGTFLTLRLHVSGKQTLDVWLAVERQWVPVKVRFTDPNGDVFEQILTELRLES